MKHAVCLLGLVVLATTSTAQRARRVAPFQVTRTTPAQNALNVPRGNSIRIRFSQPLDLDALGPGDFGVFGRWSGPCSGSLALRRGGRVLVFVPDVPFSAGETVSVALSRNVQSSLGQPLERGATFSFWVDSRASSSQFSSAGLLIPGDTPYGAYGGDIDHDQDLDLSVPNEDSSDVSVFLNTGSGSFGPATDYAVGFHASANEAGDLNLDGDTDLVVANILDDTMSVLIGNGDGTFQGQVLYASGPGPRGITLVDVEGDGDLDAVTANRAGDDLSLFVNLGDGTFSAESRLDGGVLGETGIAASDMNVDGVRDLVVVGFNDGNVRVSLGDGAGGFALRPARTLGSNPWMVVTGDVDGDGDDDAAVALAGSSTLGIAFNGGSGSFTSNTSYAVGALPIAVDLGDLNGDGRLDLTGSSFSGVSFTLYFNQGAGIFGTPQALPALAAGSCTVLHDRDGDGDVDVTGIDELADRVLLYRQDG